MKPSRCPEKLIKKGLTLSLDNSQIYKVKKNEDTLCFIR